MKLINKRISKMFSEYKSSLICSTRDKSEKLAVASYPFLTTLNSTTNKTILRVKALGRQEIMLHH